MCLIATHWSPGSTTPLTLIANRDEVFSRPTAPLHWWEGAEVLAGRDLQNGGTWLGVTVHGRMAAITNYRAPQLFNPRKSSRGEVVADFLNGSWSPTAYCLRLRSYASQYNAFNLLLYDGQELVAFESRHSKIIHPKPGVFAVSNADFNTPWPKVATLKCRLRRSLYKYESAAPENEELLAHLSDETVAADPSLPATGIPIERERALSSAFIRTADYGTRSSSLIRFGQRSATFIERRFDARGLLGESVFSFHVQRRSLFG